MASKDLDTGVVDSSKEIVESESELKQEVQRLKHQMAEWLGSQVSVAYKDLCLFPDVQRFAVFKMPKFDLYDGHGDFIAYLRGYCSKMRGVGGKDELLMAYARYNKDIIPDRLSLTKMEKRPNESFREYGLRWREQPARVNPSIEEAEMVEYFLQAQEPTYFGHLISGLGKPFNDVVKMGEMVEYGLKSSKIMSYSALKSTTQMHGDREYENPHGNLLTEVNDIGIGKGPSNFDVQPSG
ncbi:PREDICTED: uncharacterized protein LOC109232685 [Nicotiana attenuata]|uniref:uncharacterized protein LOC109232685 n=1 Tax=Nicotiana attenuata TaxID=49451 RepID=UPI000904BD2C|nr:PREDICTED: uncharacterized protein LOC109232685 [Nicotiana attenuata]